MPYVTMQNNRKLFYVEEGAGQPVVFIHGWKACSDVYELPSRLLTETGAYRCIRYDQCGHMRSAVSDPLPDMQTLAEDLHEIIRTLRLTNPILVGWSMGGATILEYLRRYGCGGISRIVVVDISPRMLNDGKWKLGRLGGNYDAADRLRDLQQMEADFPMFMRSYYGHTKPGFAALPEAEQDSVIASHLAGHHTDVLISLWRSLSASDYRDILPTVCCPAAIFHAGKLPSCSPGAAAYYQARIPAPVTLVHFKNASHALISEYPEEFTHQLRQFFETKEGT